MIILSRKSKFSSACWVLVCTSSGYEFGFRFMYFEDDYVDCLNSETLSLEPWRCFIWGYSLNNAALRIGCISVKTSLQLFDEGWASATSH